MAIEVDATAKTKYPPLAEDVYQAVVAEVCDHGEIQDKFDLTPIHKVQIVYQLNALRDDGKRHEVRSWRERLSFHEKANLRVKHIEKIIGKAKLEAMLAVNPVFDVESIVGMNCQIEIVHNASGEHANIGSVLAYRGDAPMEVTPDYVPLAKRDGYQAPGTVEHPNVTAAANLGSTPAASPVTPNAPVAPRTPTQAESQPIAASQLDEIVKHAKISFGEKYKPAMAKFIKGRDVTTFTRDEAAKLISDLRALPMHKDILANEELAGLANPFADEGDDDYRPPSIDPTQGSLLEAVPASSYGTI